MNTKTFDPRYSRQLLLPEIGAKGQEAFRRTRVLCVGAGGLGCPAALYLAAAGIGTLGLIDPDQVDESNLQRQILFQARDVGQSKAETAALRLRELNPGIEVRSHTERLVARNALEIFSRYDIILDGTDNFAAKFLINDTAVKLGLPVVHGSISQFEGRASVFWAPHGPCYRCLHPEPPKAAIQNCAEAGIIGAVAGIIGSIQAMEALKLALWTQGLPSPALRPLLGELLVVDCASMGFSSFQIKKSSGCPVCSLSPERIALADLTGPACALAPETDEITAEALGHEVPPETLFVDVREPMEWIHGHIPGAVNWPLSALRAGERFEMPSHPRIILYCQHGIRSREALGILRGEGGLSNLRHLQGGISRWNGRLARP